MPPKDIKVAYGRLNVAFSQLKMYLINHQKIWCVARCYLNYWPLDVICSCNADSDNVMVFIQNIQLLLIILDTGRWDDQAGHPENHVPVSGMLKYPWAASAAYFESLLNFTSL